MSLETVAGGLIGAAYLVPLSIAFSIAASHGKYLPLWIPYTGLLGAYLAYAMSETRGVPAMWALIVAAILSAAFAIVANYALFRGHINRGEPYAALLRAVAITVFIEAALGWATHGYALSYRHMKLGGSTYIPKIGDTLTSADLLAILSAIILAPALALLLRWTWAGLAFRSVASNRNLAREYGLPVLWIDTMALAFCGSLSAVGAIMFGMKYDLSPQMLAEPTMKVAAIVVALGAEWPERVTAGILMIGILEAVTQSSPSFAPFASAIGYVLLILALIMRYAVSLRLRRLQT